MGAGAGWGALSTPNRFEADSVGLILEARRLSGADAGWGSEQPYKDVCQTL